MSFFGELLPVHAHFSHNDDNSIHDFSPVGFLNCSQDINQRQFLHIVFIDGSTCVVNGQDLVTCAASRKEASKDMNYAP